MEDQSIIKLLECRDQRALGELLRAYGDYCHSIAKTILGSDADAEEVVSDTLLKIWDSIPPQRPNSLKLYMAKITRNISVSRWRTLTAQKRGGDQICIALEELGDCVPGGQEVEDRLDRNELSRTISTFLLGEKARDRRIFLRRYFYFDSTAEIAKDCLLKESHVLQILSRTRRRLKSYLKQEGYHL